MSTTTLITTNIAAAAAHIAEIPQIVKSNIESFIVKKCVYKPFNKNLTIFFPYPHFLVILGQASDTASTQKRTYRLVTAQLLYAPSASSFLHEVVRRRDPLFLLSLLPSSLCVFFLQMMQVNIIVLPLFSTTDPSTPIKSTIITVNSVFRSRLTDTSRGVWFGLISLSLSLFCLSSLHTPLLWRILVDWSLYFAAVTHSSCACLSSSVSPAPLRFFIWVSYISIP